MQRTMLAAVEAIEERLIAAWYLMQISAHLAFSSPNVYCWLWLYKTRISIYWMYLKVNQIFMKSFCPQKKQ